MSPWDADAAREIGYPADEAMGDSRAVNSASFSGMLEETTIGVRETGCVVWPAGADLAMGADLAGCVVVGIVSFGRGRGPDGIGLRFSIPILIVARLGRGRSRIVGSDDVENVESFEKFCE